MPLPYKITAEQFAELDAAKQELYKQADDGYELDVEGIAPPTTANNGEDLSGLKSKVDELIAEKREAQRKAKEAEEERQRQEQEAARQRGDYEQLYTSSQQAAKDWEERYKQLQNELDTKDLRLTASTLASHIASDDNNAQILSEFVQRRLKKVDGQIKVLDANGQLTVSSLEDLQREFEGSKMFASLVKGNQATGGGATGSNGGGAGKPFAQMSESERLEMYRTDPEGFKRETAKLKGAS